MGHRSIVIAIAALSFGLGVVAHSQGQRPRATSESKEGRAQVGKPGLAREETPTYQVDIDKLAHSVATLERRVRELETHVHPYVDRALAANMTLLASQLDEERYRNHAVLVASPDLDTTHGATRTWRTEQPTQ